MEFNREKNTKMDETNGPPPPDMPARPVKTILLVDDNTEIRTITKWFLGSLGYILNSARSAEEGLALFNPAIHDLVMTDNRMPGMTGTEMAHIIKMRSPTTPILMYTALPPADRTCVDLFIQKPSHFLTLRNAIASLLSAKPQPVEANAAHAEAKPRATAQL